MKYWTAISPLIIGFFSGWLFALYIMEVFVPKGELAMCRSAVNEYYQTVSDCQKRLVKAINVKPVLPPKKSKGVGGR